MPDFQEIAEAVIQGNNQESVRLAQEALDEGVSARDILKQGLVAGMDVVGQRFKCNEYYIPEVLIACRAMKEAVEVIRDQLAESDDDAETVRIVAGTVLGDLHDIGKNLVVMMLEGAGFQVIDLGVDCTPENYVAAAQENNAQIVCLSALLTTTMPSMRETIEAIEEAGLKDTVRVIVGGAPVTKEFADEIGADGYAPDAASGVDTVKELLSIGSAS